MTEPQPRLVVRSYEDAAQVLRSESFGAPDPEPDGLEFVDRSVLHLNGDAHRARRRLEISLFSKEAVLRYERDVLLQATETSIAELATADGERRRANLVEVSRRIMLRVAAAVIGLDGAGTPERLALLERCMYPLTEAVELKWTTRDRAEVVREGLEAKRIFEQEFAGPSLARRRASQPGDQPAPDLLSLLARAPESAADPDLPVREAIVYLAGSTLTTSTAIANTVIELEGWFETHPQERVRALDPDFVLAAANEALRLQPTAPYVLRTALADTSLPDGTPVATGETVYIDRAAIHRDASVFGPDAASFNPLRTVPKRIAPYGLAFGGGRHACIGRALVTSRGHASTPERDAEPARAIPVVVSALYGQGLRLDPSAAPIAARSMQRRYEVIPVVFER